MRANGATSLRIPIVTAAVSVVVVMAVVVMSVMIVVNIDRRASIPPMVPVRMSIIWMAVVAVVINVQRIRVPA